MSILEVIVLLIGFSVIAFLLYGAYQFWTEEPDEGISPDTSTKVRTAKVRTTPPKSGWPIEAVSERRAA